MADEIITTPGTPVVAGVGLDETTKAKIAGLDRTITEKVAKITELQGLFADAQAQLKARDLEKGDLTGKLSNYETQAADWQKKIEDATKSTATLQSQLEQQKLFIGPYQDLARAYADGIIRLDGLDGAAVTGYLDKFRASITGSAVAAATVALGGVTPPANPGSNNGAPNAELVEQQWEAAMQKRDFAGAAKLAEQLGILRSQK